MPVKHGLFFACMLITITVKAQVGPLNRIGRETRTIDMDTGYVKLVLRNEAFRNMQKKETASLSGLYKGDTLVKVISRIVDHESTEIMEYYFKDNELIFIYEDYKMFEPKTKNIGMIFQARYYFNKGAMINHISLGHGRTEGDDDFDLELLRMAHNYHRQLEAARNKQP
ncbi:hypothetical protein [uncultured Chitinophaga sp.]|uniref:hypothetical protein n=1 Tax=uncultured Chitinophaga sp. TaxID=339340 RepID=UPI0025F50D53|nr:hypothetical protein [uncultured Chitinophaga sp.]